MTTVHQVHNRGWGRTMLTSSVGVWRQGWGPSAPAAARASSTSFMLASGSTHLRRQATKRCQHRRTSTDLTQAGSGQPIRAVAMLLDQHLLWWEATADQLGAARCLATTSPGRWV
jgi:hypothetical protein